MPRTRPPYPPEFRREALELLRLSGRPVKEIAKELGCSDQTLYEWRRQAQVDEGKRDLTESALREWVARAEADAGRGRPGVLTTDERDELRRLRRENRVLREEREILKKAAAFFARESETR